MAFLQKRPKSLEYSVILGGNGNTQEKATAIHSRADIQYVLLQDKATAREIRGFSQQILFWSKF